MRRTALGLRWRGALGLLAATAGATLMAGGTAAAAPTASADLAQFAAELADSPHAVAQRAPGPMPTPAGGRRLEAVTASGALFDAIGDNQTLAPDLREMVAFTTDDGRYTVGIGLDSNALVPGDFVATYVDVDGNPATGDPTFGGADLAVGILGEYGDDIVGTLVWDGSDWQFASFPSLISFASGATDEVWSIAASELGIAQGSPTRLRFATLYSGVYDDYFDFAPEPGGAPLAFTLGALAPPPPAPVVPTPAAPAPVPTGTTAGTGPAATPVRVRGFTVKRASNGLRVRVGWTKGDGRIVWSVRLRAKVDGRTATRAVHGSGRPGTRSVVRLVRLPASWKGKRIALRLRMDDDIRTSVRGRTLVY